MSGDRENVALRRAEVVIQVSHEHLNRVWCAADWHGRGHNKCVATVDMRGMGRAFWIVTEV